MESTCSIRLYGQLFQLVITMIQTLNSLIQESEFIRLNKKALSTWVGERSTGNGIAMFDAEYSTYTGISNKNESEIARISGIYPNPCNNNATILLELNESEQVLVTLSDLTGQTVETLAKREYPSGLNRICFSVINLPSGMYIYSIKVKTSVSSGKLVVVK